MMKLSMIFMAVILGFGINDDSIAPPTLVNYFASFGDDILNELDNYTPTTSREKENFTSAKKYMNEKFNQLVFQRLSLALKEEKSIELEPTSTLKQYDIVYNDLGYPIPLVVKGAIKKAKKRGYHADQYYSISAYCSDVANLASASKLVKQSKPQVRIVITVFDSNGSKQQKVEGKVKRAKPIKAKEFIHKFDKLEEESMDELLNKVLPLVDKAVDQAVGKL